jgi:repressor LexA
MKQLTERQQDLYQFTLKYVEVHKFPPTFREISEHFGITVRGAYDHIKAIERKGWLRCDKNRSRTIEIVETTESDDRERVASVPLVGTVVAGSPIVSEENLEGYISVPSGMLSSGTYFALRVKGQSMINAGICEGDIALIRQQPTAENGEIVVAMIDDAVTLKRYFREANRVQLKAENPEFASIFVRDLRLLGKLAHIIRSY